MYWDEPLRWIFIEPEIAKGFDFDYIRKNVDGTWLLVNFLGFNVIFLTKPLNFQNKQYFFVRTYYKIEAERTYFYLIVVSLVFMAICGLRLIRRESTFYHSISPTYFFIKKLIFNRHFAVTKQSEREKLNDYVYFIQMKSMSPSLSLVQSHAK